MASRLTEDFNVTTAGFLTGNISASLLLTKYALLLKFQAKAPDDKAELVEALCDAALKGLDARASGTYHGYMGKSDTDAFGAILKTLHADESARHLPVQAAHSLAEIGLKFVRRAEATGDYSDRAVCTDYARLCLEHAEGFLAVIDARNGDISTSKPITAVRRIVLKKSAEPPRP